MISYLKGTILCKRQGAVILNVHDVGYKVFLAESVWNTMQEGEETQLFCALSVQEHALDLYGFPSLDAQAVFETVNRISGIGPKTALELSAFGSIGELKQAIEEQGAGVFRGMKGIGSKKMQKILLELTGAWEAERSRQESNVAEDAKQALIALGFSSRAAADALAQIPEHVIDPEEQVREALKVLGGSA